MRQDGTVVVFNEREIAAVKGMVAAAKRIGNKAKSLRDDWFEIGAGLAVGREWAARKAGKLVALRRGETRLGQGHNVAFGEWLETKKVSIGANERACALWLHDHESEIRAWLRQVDEMSSETGRALTHPRSIRAAYERHLLMAENRSLRERAIDAPGAEERIEAATDQFLLEAGGTPSSAEVADAREEAEQREVLRQIGEERVLHWLLEVVGREGILAAVKSAAGESS